MAPLLSWMAGLPRHQQFNSQCQYDGTFQNPDGFEEYNPDKDKRPAFLPALRQQQFFTEKSVCNEQKLGFFATLRQQPSYSENSNIASKDQRTGILPSLRRAFESSRTTSTSLIPFDDDSISEFEASESTLSNPSMADSCYSQLSYNMSKIDDDEDEDSIADLSQQKSEESLFSYAFKDMVSFGSFAEEKPARDDRWLLSSGSGDMEDQMNNRDDVFVSSGVLRKVPVFVFPRRFDRQNIRSRVFRSDSGEEEIDFTMDGDSCSEMSAPMPFISTETTSKDPSSRFAQDFDENQNENISLRGIMGVAVNRKQAFIKTKSARRKPNSRSQKIEPRTTLALLSKKMNDQLELTKSMSFSSKMSRQSDKKEQTKNPDKARLTPASPKSTARKIAKGPLTPVGRSRRNDKTSPSALSVVLPRKQHASNKPGNVKKRAEQGTKRSAVPANSLARSTGSLSRQQMSEHQTSPRVVQKYQYRQPKDKPSQPNRSEAVQDYTSTPKRQILIGSPKNDTPRILWGEDNESRVLYTDEGDVAAIIHPRSQRKKSKAEKAEQPAPAPKVAKESKKPVQRQTEKQVKKKKEEDPQTSVRAFHSFHSDLSTLYEASSSLETASFESNCSGVSVSASKDQLDGDGTKKHSQASSRVSPSVKRSSSKSPVLPGVPEEICSCPDVNINTHHLSQKLRKKARLSGEGSDQLEKEQEQETQPPIPQADESKGDSGDSLQVQSKNSRLKSLMDHVIQTDVRVEESGSI